MSDRTTGSDQGTVGDWRAALTEGGRASREQWAIVCGLAISGWMLPAVAGAVVLMLAAGVAAAVRCPRWVSVLLVAVAVPLLVFSAVTGTEWYA